MAKVVQVVKVATVGQEIGTGVTEARLKLLAVRAEQSIGWIVVEHKDRLTRLGLRSVQRLLTTPGRVSEIVNQAENWTQDLVADLCAPVSTLRARRSGPQRPATGHAHDGGSHGARVSGDERWAGRQGAGDATGGAPRHQAR